MYLGEDIVISIGHEAWRFGQTDIYIAIKTPDGVNVAKPIDLVFERMEEGMAVEPTLRVDSHMAHALFQALADALDKEGIKTVSEANLEGVLEATQYHLEDMRQVAGVKK